MALHHMQRGNSLGATRLLTAAQRKLESYPPSFAAINVHLLTADIAVCLDLLATNPTAPNLPPPRIHLHSK